MKNARDRILDAYAQLMTEKDLRRITVKDVYERAKVSKPTYYYHFSCMEDIQEALVEQFVSLYRKSAAREENMSQEDDAIVSLRQKTESAFTYIYEHRELFVTLVRSPLKWDLYERLVAVFQESAARYDYFAQDPDNLNAVTGDARRMYVAGHGWEMVGWLDFWVDEGFEHNPEQFAAMMVRASSINRLFFKPRR